MGDLGGVGCGGDQVDIVGPARLKGQHHGGQSFHRNGGAMPQMADGIILAEDAFKGAVGKKNGSGTPGSRDRGFLAKVEGVT